MIFFFSLILITLLLSIRMPYRIVGFISVGALSLLLLLATLTVYNFNNLTCYTSDLVLTKNWIIGVSVGVDGVSALLVWLTCFIGLLCAIYNLGSVGFGFQQTTALLIAMVVMLVTAFLVTDLLQFYFLFEIVLIPMLFIIFNGSRGRKKHAVGLFFYYTFASSILLLTGIWVTYNHLGDLSFVNFFNLSKNLSPDTQLTIFVLFFFGFAAKIPLIPFHLWLPEAHVEAPTTGSVFLAAILLKLGGYGMYRTLVPLCDAQTFSIVRPIIIPFLLLSVVYSATVAIRQTDLKKIVAYSSISHMSFSLLGLMGNDEAGITGFLFLMISHGLISAAMFFLVGMLYDRFHTRNLLYYGGLVQFMPLFSIAYFIILFSNLSFPSTCNFIGELLVLSSIGKTQGFTHLFISLIGLFYVVVFCLILIYRTIFYQTTGFLTTNLVDITIYEALILVALIIPIILFGIYPNAILAILKLPYA